MNKIVRRYISPLGILIVGSFFINLLQRLVPKLINGNIYYLLGVLMLFAFGISLNNKSKTLKTFRWRHIIIILIFILLFLYDTKLLNVNVFDWFRSYIIFDNIIIKIFYVYFGWLFVER